MFERNEFTKSYKIMGERLDGIEGKSLASTAFVLTLGTDRQPGIDVVRFGDYSVVVVDGKGNASLTTPYREYISELENATLATEALLALPLDALSPPIWFKIVLLLFFVVPQ